MVLSLTCSCHDEESDGLMERLLGLEPGLIPSSDKTLSLAKLSLPPLWNSRVQQKIS